MLRDRLVRFYEVDAPNAGLELYSGDRLYRRYVVQWERPEEARLVKVRLSLSRKVGTVEATDALSSPR